MNVCEFIEFAKMKLSSTDLFGLVEIKEYLPFHVKKGIAELMAEKQIIFVNGLACTDTVINSILLDIAIIEAYTNLTFSKTASISEYEEMAALGLTEMLKLRIGNDCLLVEKYFAATVEEITKLYNSFEGQTSRSLSLITNKAISVLDDIQKNIDKDTIVEAMTTLRGFDLNNIFSIVKKTFLKGRD